MERFEIAKSSLRKLSKTHTDGQIGDMYGISAEVIRLRRIEHDIPPRGRRSFDPPKTELKKLYQKHSMKAIAEMYGVGETVVFKRLKEHGITLKGYERGGHRLKPGRKFSEDHLTNLRAIAKARRGKFTGKDNPNWKGGLTELNGRARRSGAYKEWKTLALTNADYKCQNCGVKHHSICDCCGTRVSLHVHHIKSFAKHPELRYSQSNAEVLCPKCHYNHH